jgi:hypothetical protein
VEDKKTGFKWIDYKWYFIYEVMIFGVIFLIWWFRGAHTARRYSDISFLVGSIVMFIGVLIFQGSRGTTGSFGYQYASTSGESDLNKRVHRDWKERLANEKQMLIWIGIGLIPILVGIFAYKIWG